jgi:hypothetical protein
LAHFFRANVSLNYSTKRSQTERKAILSPLRNDAGTDTGDIAQIFVV